MEATIQEIDQLLKKNDCIVVACSGGPDSMALLSILCHLKEEKNITLICCHVNHKVREESDQEAKFVKEYCQKKNVIFELMNIDYYDNQNFHDQARQKRYHFFNKIVLKYQATILFTAHHADDLVETILMRLTRGSTFLGYSGFPKKSQYGNYLLLRPFINITKEQIIEYDDIHHIPYVLDSSNEKDKYTRNRFRKYVVPFLKKENPKVHHQMYHFGEQIRKYNAFVVKETQKVFDKVYQEKRLYIPYFTILDEIIQETILTMILDLYYQKRTFQVKHCHIQAIQDLIQNPKPNCQYYLPKNLVVKKEYEHLEFTEEIIQDGYCIELKPMNILPNGKHIEQIKEIDQDGNDICRLKSEDITLPLCIRTRRKSDRINIKGMLGTKKISDIFIDQKIPKSSRELWPIIQDSSGKIVWIPGLKKSKINRSKEEKCDIILRYY